MQILMKPILIKKLLIIGGASRNVGKTALASRIINKFSNEVSIIALKIKTIRKGDNFFHGKDINPLKENEPYRITEETYTGNEDTQRMLTAGANRIFKIKVRQEYLSESFNYFKTKLNSDDFIICESNSLRYVVKPALFLFIKPSYFDEMKPSAIDLVKFADVIIPTDGKKHNFTVSRLKIDYIEKMWFLD